MNTREIEICDVNEDQILSLMAEILEVDLETAEDMVTDDEARTIAKEIYTLIAELGERKYARPQAATYPENYEEDERLLMFSWEATKNGPYGCPLYWSDQFQDWRPPFYCDPQTMRQLAERGKPDGFTCLVKAKEAVRIHYQYYVDFGDVSEEGGD